MTLDKLLPGPAFEGRTGLELWFTPWNTPNGELEARFAHLCGLARGPVEENWYNVSLPMVFEQIDAMIARGIDVEATFDHVQWSGASERPLGQALISKHAQQARDGKFLVGTSLHSTIDHLKGVGWNVQKDGYEVPDGDYPTVDAAMADGYPVTWLGSWNPSKGASTQYNFVAIVPGKDVNNAYHRGLAELRDFIRTNESRYNPWLVP